MMEVENKDSELRQINARFNAVETLAKNAEVRWDAFSDENASNCLSVIWIWILNGQVVLHYDQCADLACMRIALCGVIFLLSFS